MCCFNFIEGVEAWDALEELEGGNFRFAAFTKQLERKGFRLAGVGQFFTFEGRYGSLQIEQALLGGDPKIIACSYIPSGDPGRAYALVTEGISTTGRSLSGEDLGRAHGKEGQ